MFFPARQSAPNRSTSSARPKNQRMRFAPASFLLIAPHPVGRSAPPAFLSCLGAGESLRLPFAEFSADAFAFLTRFRANYTRRGLYLCWGPVFLVCLALGLLAGPAGISQTKV